MSAKRKPGPVGPGYMPKGGAAAARRANDRWSAGQTREGVADPARPPGVVWWAVVATCGLTTVTELSILWVLFS